MYDNNGELSERETEILRLVATGASNKEIARDLHISVNTVKVHLRNIFSKLEVSSRTEAAIYAVNAGVVPSITSNDYIEEKISAGEQNELSSTHRVNGQIVLRFKTWLWVIIGLLLLMVLAAVLFNYFDRQNNNPDQQGAILELSSPGWQNLATIPTARHSFAIVAHENNIFLIGGKSGGEVVGINERYDAEADFWTTASPKPTPVYEVGAVVIGGEIFVPGGRLESGDVTDILEIYDPRLDRWRSGPSLPFSVSAYSVVDFEGRLYLFGGWNGKKYLDIVLELDPRSEAWKLKEPMSSPRGYTSSAISRDKIYVFGGYNGRKVFTQNEIYYPSMDDGVENPWGIAAPMPEARYAMGATSLADLIYTVGGQGEGGEVHGMFQYSPDTDQWFTVIGGNTPSWPNLGLVSLTTKLYALGGQSNSFSLDENLVYRVIYTISIPVVPVGPPK